jgi:hypothetical protein
VLKLRLQCRRLTPRIGVNPEFVDAEEIQRGVSALFILDRKFDACQTRL